MKKSLCFVLIFVQFLWCFVCFPIESDESDEYEDKGWYDDSDEFSEYGKFFQGDMDLDEDQLADIFGERNAKRNESFRWKSAIVPFQISSDHDAEYTENILKAMKEMEKVSCVRFRQRSNETDYVQIQANENGCYSKVGRRGGKQSLNLSPNEPHCMKIGVIIHELLHTLGFHHMQSASDRDNYVRINLDNIETNKTKNFERYNSSDVMSFDLPYDFGSILHYKSSAFSKDPRNPEFRHTIEPVVGTASLWRKMGQRESMSEIDVLRLNAMYKCEATIKTSFVIFSLLSILYTLWSSL